MTHPPRPQQRPQRVRLRKELSRAIESGRPWVYRDALQKGPEPESGALVTLLARSGRPLAWGYFDRAAPIAVRVLGLAPAPADVGAVIDERLRAALALRLSQLDLDATNVFRWAHGEADRLPGIHVDVYDRHAVVRFDGEGARRFYADLGARLARVAAHAGEPRLRIERVIERQPRGASKDDVPEGAVIEVRENGLRFGADLVHGQKGGLFLDQRDNRAALASHARGRSVLNVFSYTGAFSVYCAAAGATRVDTVDIAKPAIAAARENFRRNDLPVERAGFHAEDAFAFLQRAAASDSRWDIVITDPPSFAPSQKALSAGLAAYRKLHTLALAVVAPGGLLCAASCSSHVTRASFIETIEQAARTARRKIRVREVRGASFDHPVVAFFPEGDYLKFVMVDVT